MHVSGTHYTYSRLGNQSRLAAYGTHQRGILSRWKDPRAERYATTTHGHTDDESNLIIFGETCSNNLFPWVSIRGFTVSWLVIKSRIWGDDDQKRDYAEKEEYNNKIHQHSHRVGCGARKLLICCTGLSWSASGVIYENGCRQGTQKEITKTTMNHQASTPSIRELSSNIEIPPFLFDCLVFLPVCWADGAIRVCFIEKLCVQFLVVDLCSPMRCLLISMDHL